MFSLVIITLAIFFTHLVISKSWNNLRLNWNDKRWLIMSLSTRAAQHHKKTCLLEKEEKKGKPFHWKVPCLSDKIHFDGFNPVLDKNKQLQIFFKNFNHVFFLFGNYFPTYDEINFTNSTFLSWDWRLPNKQGARN